MKAIVNREVAERELGDEEVQASVNRQIRSISMKKSDDTSPVLQSSLEELEIKINKVYDSMLMKFKNYNVETEAMLDEF